MIKNESEEEDARTENKKNNKEKLEDYASSVPT